MEFDKWYHELEDTLGAKQHEIIGRAEELKAQVRSNPALSDEEREATYNAGYDQLYRELEDAANTLVAAVENERAELVRRVHEGTGERFGQYITALANVPDERLSEQLAVAQKTGQEDLAHAVAEVAWERNRFEVFNQWASANPEKAEALQRLHGLPEKQRLHDRTKARTFVPDVTLESLRPSPEVRERYARAMREKEEREQQAQIRAEMERRFLHNRRPTGVRRVGRRAS